MQWKCVRGWIVPQSYKEKLKYDNIWLVRLGNTRVLTDLCLTIFRGHWTVNYWRPCASMNTENRPLVTYEPVEFENNRLKFKTLGNLPNLPTVSRNLLNIPQIDKDKPKDVNMKLVGLGNTRILTCPKISPDTVVHSSCLPWATELLSYSSKVIGTPMMFPCVDID
jgi:hypothetical protein